MFGSQIGAQLPNPAIAATTGATGGLGATGGNAISRGVAGQFGASPQLGAAPAQQGGLQGLMGQLGTQGIGSIANILSSLFGGQQIAGGFGDLESQIQQGIGQQQQSLAQALGLLEPFQTGGATAFQQALSGLQAQGAPTQNVQDILSQFQQSPAQQATIQQGLGAVQSRLGAQGLGQSGAEQKALEQFAQQGTAGQQEQFLRDVLGQQQAQQAGLGQLAGIGAGAAGTGAGAAMQAGTNIADLLESLGMSQLSGAQAGAQGQSGLFGSIGSLVGSLFGL